MSMPGTYPLSIESIREQLPSTRAAAYLNTGTAGPLPAVTAAAMAEEARAELETGRISPNGFPQLRERITALRAELADLVGAEPAAAALTQGTTVGMNIAVHGLEWKAGDEVVTTTQEHGGALLPLYVLHRRHGIKVTFADVGNGEAGQALEGLRRAIHPGVKAVVLSHVLYTTGATLPLKEITELAHAAGCLVIVDGAQSVGAIPVDAPALGVDAYAFSGQKWLCGPESTGGLYVAAHALDRFQPTYISFMGIDHDGYRWDDASVLPLNDGASRYEFVLPYRPSIAGLRASLGWVRDQVGRKAALRSIAENAHYCWERAHEVPGAQVLTPGGQLAGLIALKVAGQDPAKIVERLAAEGVLIRSIPENGALRISTGFYNTREDIDRAMQLLAT
ncbi:MAG TPA: aminotransferase class V-fold PLP-dependent enzyme [Candidatus Dormibacteraeota bacterium]